MQELTPALKQYYDLREQNPDCILFFRMGDFYEMFGSDAVVASDLLNITLTSRDRGKDEKDRTPMCGVPYHSVEAYVARLIERGYKVAICEQTEDPALAKGLVKREVVRVITPGTVVESSFMDEKTNNYLASVSCDGESTGVAFADITSGEYFATQTSSLVPEAMNELGRFYPREVLLSDNAAGNKSLSAFVKDKLSATVSPLPFDGDAEENILNAFKKTSLAAAGLVDKPLAAAALNGLLIYVRSLNMQSQLPLTLNVYGKQRYMELDITAKRNLELTEPMYERAPGEKKGTLLWALDHTGSSSGARLLRSWIERPLTSPGDIERRQKAVAEFAGDIVLRLELRESIKNQPDMERIIARVVYGTANARDLKALSGAAGRMPLILSFLAPVNAPLLREIANSCDDLSDICQRLDSAIVDEPPFSIREGGFIRDGYNAEVDRLRALMSSAKEMLSALEAREREKTGIKTLKVGYNKVFGYYLEVSKSYIGQVPGDYIRKQTLTNGERYCTEELKNLENDILSAGDKLRALEGELFNELKAFLTQNAYRIQRAASAAAQLDVLAGFADAAVKYRYCCPEVDSGDILFIEEGRHPVVERMMDDGMFVPNDTSLSGEYPTSIITGPNMAGKSTYMRQTALLTLMTQIGSFIPAKSARIGVVDRIFTRVGASDDLSGGRSTFMVEMTEVADIVKYATKKSLIILDEVGRGTSTFDGMSVARAVLEHIHRKIGAKTLFATHYHELTDMEEMFDGIKNYNVAVKKRGEEIIFLRRIVPGSADDSFGVEVARLAGLPDSIIARAKNILKDLEDGSAVRDTGRKKKYAPEEDQVSLETIAKDELLRALYNTDADTLTPIEALNKLYQLRKKALELNL